MRLLGLLLALTPKGAAALLEGGRTFRSFEEYRAWPGRPRPVRRRRVTIESSRPAPSQAALLRTKKVLLATMCVGAAAYLGSDGTFASFSAETANTGTSISSGTLTMDNNSCKSEAALTQNNVNQNCSAVLTLTNAAPGVYVTNGTATVSIKNTGSIDASKLYLYASSTNAKLSGGGLTSGTPYTALPVTALQGQIASGDQIVLTYGTNTQTFTANGATAAGATSISVNSLAANFSYPANTTVTDTTTPVTTSNMNCFDAKTPTGGSTTGGVDLNFNPITGNPLCVAVVMYIQETTGGNYYCWYGPGKTGAFCTTPVSVTTTGGTLSGTVTSIPVTSLNGVVKSGDTVTLTNSSGTTATCSASATVRFTATAIGVSSCALGASFAAGSTVVDTTALNALNSETTNTLKSFDTGNNISGKITLYPVTADGTINSSALVHLAAGSTRTFQVGLFLPAPSGANQNAIQGLSSTFGMTWHMDQ